MTIDIHDRVRTHTAPDVNHRLDEEAAKRIESYARADVADITARIEALEREWDIERVLETNASALAVAGLALGLTKNPRWLILPAIVLPFLLQHAVQGWCPPLPILRRLGVRVLRNERVAIERDGAGFDLAAARNRAAQLDQ